MKTKAHHTPGPWQIKDDSYPTEIRNPQYVDVICKIGNSGLGVNDIEANEANARLIASAPELLEAAIQMDDLIAVWRMTGTMPALGLMAKAEDNLKAAIAKAQGK